MILKSYTNERTYGHRYYERDGGLHRDSGLTFDCFEQYVSDNLYLALESTNWGNKIAAQLAASAMKSVNLGEEDLTNLIKLCNTGK